MGRRRRNDEPGAPHHIMTRGIARRAIYQDSQDVRYLHSCWAKEVHRGAIAIHAYSTLTTHAHLLATSRDGRISESMQRVGGRYSRYANRRYRRDGPLMRGRFTSKRIRSRSHFRNTVSYIDRNPVEARLAVNPWDYPHGSAAKYAHGTRCLWLDPTPLERMWARMQGLEGPDDRIEVVGESYKKCFPARRNGHLSELVERRFERPYEGPDELDSLIDAAPPRVLAWMQRKAMLADGMRLGLPMVVPAAVDAALVRWSPALDALVKPTSGRPFTSKELVHVGLLRSLACATWAEIARLCNLSESTCRRHNERHRKNLLHEPLYAEASAAAVQRALAITFGADQYGTRNESAR